ncbi:MAG: hypothetical protein MJ188_03220 [Treponema sp.]|nr:hypothetical protein [Treponema sp.]
MLVTLFIFTSTQLFSIDMPEMPRMPEISQPSVGEPFYQPTGNNYSQWKNKDNKKNDGGNGEKNKNATNTATTSSTDAYLMDGFTTDDLFSSLLGGASNRLTASDISTLYDTGMFDNISGLNNSINSSSTNTTNLLLRQMLTSLEELKMEQKNATPAEKENYKTYQQDSQNFRKREPLILRFKVNGYNINDSLTNFFFSKPESDGSFLFTADRKYYANQKSRNETFYLLFKANGSNGSVTYYDVIPSIAQDAKNTNSYVYKLCQQKNLKAEKTGNLVVVHHNKDGFAADILLDIDK